MTVQELIRDTIRPLVPEVTPEPYDGDASTYCTYQAAELPTLFANGRPDTIRYHAYLHLYLPAGENPIRLKSCIAKAIWTVGATYPSITNASDKDGQHYVFAFEIGGDPDGNV